MPPPAYSKVDADEVGVASNIPDDDSALFFPRGRHQSFEIKEAKVIKCIPDTTKQNR